MEARLPPLDPLDCIFPPEAPRSPSKLSASLGTSHRTPTLNCTIDTALPECPRVRLQSTLHQPLALTARAVMVHAIEPTLCLEATNLRDDGPRCDSSCASFTPRPTTGPPSLCASTHTASMIANCGQTSETSSARICRNRGRDCWG